MLAYVLRGALSNEDNWRKTHRLAGVVTFVAGILILLLGIINKAEFNETVFLVIVALMVLIPYGYSYMIYKNGTQKEKENQDRH